jgi:hypothetical protein
MQMKTIVALGLLAATSAAQATTTVTFDGTANNTQVLNVTNSGYSFDAPANVGALYVWDAFSPNSNGTDNLIFGFAPNDVVTITKVGGGGFKLVSVDLAVSWYSAVSPNTILANGTPLTIDSTLTTYTFNAIGTSFTLSGLASDDGYWIADNFVFDAVPEPASWAMLIAGFGLTGAAMRRRRTAVAA